MNSVFCKLQ